MLRLQSAATEWDPLLLQDRLDENAGAIDHTEHGATRLSARSRIIALVTPNEYERPGEMRIYKAGYAGCE